MEGTRLIWLLTLCAAAVLSGKIPVKDDCALGPEFWCQDLMTAAQCGAVDHCKQTAWLGIDVLCVQCKQIVNILLDMVKASPIQDTIKKFLHKQCSHLPVVPLIAQCNLLVDQYESMMVTVLEKQVNPDTLCSTLRLCQSDQEEFWNNELQPEMILEKIFPLIQEHLYNAHEKATQGDGEDLPIPKPMCWMCKSFISQLEKVIPKTVIAKAASQLCRILPAKVAGVCQCLVEKYTVILLDIVLEKLGPQLLCKLLFMCATDENCEADLPVIPVLDIDFACDTCLAVTSAIKPTIKQNMTQAEVEAAVLKAHGEPGMAWKEIQTFLKNHHTELSLLLHKQWDHRMTCQALGACPVPANAAAQHSGCTVGPSYWCQNLETAKDCGAVSHCLTHVWH
ncbi:hypothetical protein XELAEV_18018608mg [Xenopus laevis]|uniref:Pulmonary surfactant-associated protein B n=1 Tax=Xenopus laevis TaxID=8355 RepID=A0A974DDD3_XENLA|nr:hypothetical protein XELAEV_18018608mg [Xenopus laevis]